VDCAPYPIFFRVEQNFIRRSLSPLPQAAAAAAFWLPSSTSISSPTTPHIQHSCVRASTTLIPRTPEKPRAASAGPPRLAACHVRPRRRLPRRGPLVLPPAADAGTGAPAGHSPLAYAAAGLDQPRELHRLHRHPRARSASLRYVRPSIQRLCLFRASPSGDADMTTNGFCGDFCLCDFAGELALDGDGRGLLRSCGSVGGVRGVERVRRRCAAAAQRHRRRRAVLRAVPLGHPAVRGAAVRQEV
jgi:hypothetical protein